MSVRNRALIIGFMGPAIQATGFIWQVLHFYLYHLHDSFSVRHLLFEPGFLMVVVGFLVSLVCVPLATEVAAARPDELEIPAFGEDDEMQGALPLPGAGGATTLPH